MMSILGKLTSQLQFSYEQILIFTIIPLIVISGLLTYYYIHSTIQYAPNKRSCLNIRSDTSLAILKRIQSIDLLDQYYFMESQRESVRHVNFNSKKKNNSNQKQQSNNQVEVKRSDSSLKKLKDNNRREVKKNKRSNIHGKQRNMYGYQNQGYLSFLPIIEEQQQY